MNALMCTAAEPNRSAKDHPLRLLGDVLLVRRLQPVKEYVRHLYQCPNCGLRVRVELPIAAIWRDE